MLFSHCGDVLLGTGAAARNVCMTRSQETLNDYQLMTKTGTGKNYEKGAIMSIGL